MLKRTYCITLGCLLNINAYALVVENYPSPYPAAPYSPYTPYAQPYSPLYPGRTYPAHPFNPAYPEVYPYPYYGQSQANAFNEGYDVAASQQYVQQYNEGYKEGFNRGLSQEEGAGAPKPSAQPTNQQPLQPGQVPRTKYYRYILPSKKTLPIEQQPPGYYPGEDFYPDFLANYLNKNGGCHCPIPGRNCPQNSGCSCSQK